MNRSHAKLLRNLRSLRLKLREAELNDQEPDDEVFFAYMATWQALAVRDDALSAPYIGQGSEEPAEVDLVGRRTNPWMDSAQCATADADSSFSAAKARSVRRAVRETKKACSGCPMRSECLQHALVNDEKFGIWGGLSEGERRRLRGRVALTV